MSDITITKHKKRFKTKKSSRNILSKTFSKILISIIFVLSSLIFTNISDKTYALYKDNVINNNIRFSKIRRTYEKYFGKIVPNKTDNTKAVFNEVENNYKIEPYLDGEKLTYNGETNIVAIQSGIVVYIGEKENLGNTVIIQGIDDADIWYSGIKNCNLKLYDYVSKDKVIGQVDDTLYLNIIKNKNHLKYDEYIKTI